jgi:hypothetical protein
LKHRCGRPSKAVEEGIEIPFAGYETFEQCVLQNMKKNGWSRERASAYCGAIKHRVEDAKEERGNAESTRELDLVA